MNITPIVQIVMNLPPQDCGVGHYALTLARELRLNCGILTRFVIVGAEADCLPCIEGFPVMRIPVGTSKSLNSAVDRLRKTEPSLSSVLLHFTPYGYAKRGCPFWLLEAIRDLRRKWRVVTFVHEVGTAGPPWSSSFWLRPFQRRIVAGIARRSDVLFTTTEHFAEKLGTGVRKPIHRIPIPSNVGEETDALPLGNRARELVVFGLPDTRHRVYSESRSEIDTLCSALAITKIVDIGPPLRTDSGAGFQVPIVSLGRIPTEQVHMVLTQALAGMVMYRHLPLAKSGVFAAFAAHAMLPIAVGGLSGDGLKDGVQFIRPREVPGTSNAELQHIATAAHRWYLEHGIREHARLLAGCLRTDMRDHNG